MKPLVWVMAVFISTCFFFPLLGRAQNAVMLTNYIFSGKGKPIGRIVPANTGNSVTRMTLTGASARLFSIDRNRNLVAGKTFTASDKRPWHDVMIESVTARGPVTDTFRVVRDTFIRNQVIAHRGAWKNTGATENSLAALQHAIRLGCGGSEFDVHMSADSVLFIHHDAKIGEIAIEHTPAIELQKLTLANGEPLPTLAAYLQKGTKQTATRLILEIKPSMVSKQRSLALAKKVVQLVRHYKAQAWVDYISFDYDILMQVQRLDPYARLAYLNGDKAPAELARDHLYGFDYHYSVLQKNESWIAEAHRQKLTVNAWTVNDPGLMDWLLARKADFITTNEPEMLLRKLKETAGQ